MPSLAVLIDAENVPPSYWPAARQALQRIGTPSMIRAYVCHEPAPGWVKAADVEIIDGRPANGGNAADFLLAMDAAVIAMRAEVEAFALVTGDDDFATVAHILKRGGAGVYALIPLRGNAVPSRLAAVADLAVLVRPEPGAATVNEPSVPVTWQAEVLAAIERVAGADWIDVSSLGVQLKRIQKPKGKLSEVLQLVDGLELRGKPGQMEVRLRDAPSASDNPFAPEGEDEYDLETF